MLLGLNMKKDVFLQGEKAVNNKEIKDALHQIELLRQYIAETNPKKKRLISKAFSLGVKIAFENSISAEEMIERLTLAVQKDQFRPRDMSLYGFALSSDLGYVGGEFSTFDEKLAQRVKENRSPLDLKFDILLRLSNKDNVAAQYVADLMQILEQEPQLRDAAIKCGRTGAAREYGKILGQIVQKLRDKMGIAQDLTVEVVDSWDGFLKRFPREGSMDGSLGVLVVNTIYINRALIYEQALMVRNDEALFNKIIAVLFHEFGHFVDQVAPNKGMLGAQIFRIDRLIYEKFDPERAAEYKLNPTEASSYAIEKMVQKALEEKSNG